MQSFITISVSFLMLVFHLTAGFGFGVHKCNSRQTSDILLFERNKSCDQIHEACSCGTNSCSSEQQHTGDCCSTEIHTLESDYDTVEGISQSIPVKDSLRILFSDSIFVLSNNVVLKSRYYINLRGGPYTGYERERFLSSISQWLL